MKKYDEENLQRMLQDPSTQREAFKIVVQTYSQPIYWQIRRMVYNHDDADDLLQNTFLKAWDNLSSFRGESQLSTWLYRIAINESLSFLRQKRENLTLDDPEAAIAYELKSDEYFDGDETEIRLQQALNTLPDKQRLVFNLRYYQEMKYEEMSHILQTSIGALKASSHLAVKKIEAFFDTND